MRFFGEGGESDLSEAEWFLAQWSVEQPDCPVTEKQAIELQLMGNLSELGLFT